MVNLAHLNFLAEEVEIKCQPMLLMHIYAEASRYKWTDASGEGLAALDDTARAVLVYLDYYRATQDQQALQCSTEFELYPLYAGRRQQRQVLQLHYRWVPTQLIEPVIPVIKA